MDTLTIVLTSVAALVLLYLVIKLLAAPIRFLFKLLINAALGFLLLFAANFLGGFIGISLPFSTVNALVAGFLGIPGVILLILVQFLF